MEKYFALNSGMSNRYHRDSVTNLYIGLDLSRLKNELVSGISAKTPEANRR